jgi:hypothetical protein
MTTLNSSGLIFLKVMKYPVLRLWQRKHLANLEPWRCYCWHPWPWYPVACLEGDSSREWPQVGSKGVCNGKHPILTKMLSAPCRSGYEGNGWSWPAFLLAFCWSILLQEPLQGSQIGGRSTTVHTKLESRRSTTPHTFPVGYNRQGKRLNGALEKVDVWCFFLLGT